jgi:hypothetical protein
LPFRPNTFSILNIVEKLSKDFIVATYNDLRLARFPKAPTGTVFRGAWSNSLKKSEENNVFGNCVVEFGNLVIE